MSELPKHHQSGAAKRKKKKEREEDAKRSQGAMLKFLNQQPSNSTAPSQDVTGECFEASSGSPLPIIDQVEAPTADSFKQNNNSVQDFSTREIPMDSSTHEDSEISVEAQTQNASNVPIESTGEATAASGREHNKDEMLDFTDIGNWPSVLTDSMRLYVVQQESAAVQNFNNSNFQTETY